MEAINEINKELCIRLRLNPDSKDIINSLPRDQREPFVSLLESGGKIEINDTLWISANSFLPKREFFEITANIPVDSSLQGTQFIRLNTTNIYEFDHPISIKEINLPIEAKAVSCIEPEIAIA